MHLFGRLTSVGGLALLAVLLAGCGGPAEPGTPTGGPAPPAGTTPAAAPDFESVVRAVEDRVEVYDGIATGVIALVRVGEQTKVVTAGRAEVRAKRDMGPGLTFPIASITKPMTATLVMQLVDERRIGLGDDARSWIPELKGAGTPITIEQLLSHRSGLREPQDAEIRRVGLDTADLVRASASHPLDFEPGARGTYSNVGFGALGLLVERVLDQPLEQAMAERIFDPAGMESSSLGGSPDVQGYTDDEAVRNYYLDFLPPAGSVVATASDVDRFFGMLWAGRLVSQASVKEMRESRGAVQIGPFWNPDYGLGLIHSDVTCGTALGHSGRMDGFTTEAWTLEDGSRSAVVAINDLGVDEIGRAIVDTALCGG